MLCEAVWLGVLGKTQDAGIISLTDLKRNYEPITSHDVKQTWDFWYEESRIHCTHGRNCRIKKAYGKCNFGARQSIEYLVTGAIIPGMEMLSQIWNL